MKQLGRPTPIKENYALPIVTPLISNGAIQAGKNFTCAKDSTNTMCWGENNWGQAGNSLYAPSITSHTLSLPAYGKGSIGLHQSCIIGSSGADTGKVFCWGANTYGGGFGGQIGADFTTTPKSPAPIQVPVVTDAKEISTGGQLACAITGPLGEVICWGNNNWQHALFGSLGHVIVPTENLTGIPMASTLPMYYVKNSPTTRLKNAKKIQVGSVHTCIINNLGGVECWGLNAGAITGTVAPTVSAVTALPAPLNSGVDEIALGSRHTCGLKSGNVYCVGHNAYGALGRFPPSNAAFTLGQVLGLPSNIVKIESGEFHTCALTSTNDAWCWGRGDSGELGGCSYTAAGTGTHIPAQVMASCTPPPQNINGACNTTTMGGTFSHPGPSATPPTNLCATGTPSAVTQQTVTPYNWLWTCAGTGTGTTASCNARNVPGKCGSADMGSFNSSSIPAASALCATGNPIAAPVSSGGTWTWSCSGAPVVSCSAKDDSLPPTNGVCGPGSGPPVDASIAAIPTPYCTSGTPSPSVLINTTPTWVPWSCVGANGGTTVQCGTKILAPTPKIGVFPSAGTGCSISPSTNTSLGPGMTVTFTATAAAGYLVGTTTGTCPGLPTLTNPVTIGPINTNCTIKANCVANPLGEEFDHFKVEKPKGTVNNK